MVANFSNNMSRGENRSIAQVAVQCLLQGWKKEVGAGIGAGDRLLIRWKEKER